VSSTVFYESASELATLTNTFSVLGVPTDPTAISLVVTDPTGAATTYTFALAEITKISAGVYTKDIACTVAGEWQYVWVGTGAAQDVQAGTWTVWETSLGHLYATVEALKSRLGITHANDDAEIHGACFAASRWVEQYCQRIFYRSAAATVRTFIPTGSYNLKLPVFNELVSVSALKTDAAGDGTFGTTWTAADFQLLPYNPSAAPEQRPYEEIQAIGGQTFPINYGYSTSRRDRVQVTGVFGWPSVPRSVREGALLKAAEIFKLKEAPFGVAGADDFGLIRIRENLPVQALLGPYRRYPVLVA
jgi:hypothetical protein